jgi:hypothetical protein
MFDEVGIFSHRRKNPLDRDDLLEALDTEALGLEHLGHSANANSVEKQIFAVGDRLPHTLRMVTGSFLRHNQNRGQLSTVVHPHTR